MTSLDHALRISLHLCLFLTLSLDEAKMNKCAFLLLSVFWPKNLISQCSFGKQIKEMLYLNFEFYKAISMDKH
jgi:hypothetical protein